MDFLCGIWTGLCAYYTFDCIKAILRMKLEERQTRAVRRANLCALLSPKPNCPGNN
jgi:hypothetical protein